MSCVTHIHDICMSLHQLQLLCCLEVPGFEAKADSQFYLIFTKIRQQYVVAANLSQDSVRDVWRMNSC